MNKKINMEINVKRFYVLIQAIVIISLIYMLWSQSHLIMNMILNSDNIKEYDIFIEHAKGKIHLLKWHNGRSYIIKSYDMSFFIVYEKGYFKNNQKSLDLALGLEIKAWEWIKHYESILLKNPDLHKWKQVDDVDYCEMYLGDKDYLFAEIMRYEVNFPYEVNSRYVKLYLTYTDEVKSMLKEDGLWPVFENSSVLKLEVDKSTVRMTKGEITERSKLFDELKNHFFSNYRQRPAFFIMYDDKEYQVLLAQKFKFKTYSDIFHYRRSEVLDFINNNKDELLKYYLNKK